MTKEYHNGPISDQKRTCTDRCCLIIFVIFTIVMLGIGIYAWTHGNFSKLTTPYDPDGKGCGNAADGREAFPYIYFASPHADSLWVTVCVSKCPVDGDSVLQCATNSVVSSCSPNNNADDTKAVQIYDTFETAGVCIPTSNKLQGEISSALGSGATDAISTLASNYELLLIAIPIAIVLSLIFLLIIRYTAGAFVYILIVLSLGSLIGFGAYLIAVAPDASSTGIISNQPVRIAIAITCFILAAIIAVMFCCFRSKIALASSIIKVSARFVSDNCGIVFLPIILFAIMLVFLVLWVLEALGYYSLGTPITAPQQLPFQHFDTDWKIKALGLVHVFYLFWVLMFLIDTGHFIIGGAATSWYFKRQNPYAEASGRYRRFHIGSVCLGSFFLALLGFIKFLYELLTPQTTKEEGCMSSYKKFCDCLCCLCVTYLFSCFNSGAYTFINLSGRTYCDSAFEVLAVKIKDIATTSVVTVLQVIFTVLVRLGITSLTVLAIYIIVKSVAKYSDSVTDSTLILIMVGVIAFTISSFFISVYSEAIDAIYVSYLIDVEAGGDLDKCPDQLKDFLAQAKRQNQDI